MRLPLLDERLQKAANMFPACAYGADIGADHGRLSCYLLAHNRCKRMCISDLSAPSLEKAKRLINMHGMSERADFRVGNGLQVLQEKADAIAVLGMGGKTIATILQKGKDKLRGARLIVSAHTEVPLLRKALVSVGYMIEEEEIAHAGGRFYILINAVPGDVCYSEEELLIGPKLMKNIKEHYIPYLEWRRGVLSCENSDEGKKLLAMVEEALKNAADSQ